MKKYKPTYKTYYFTTVKDIVDQLTEDQIDPFLIDFGKWLKLTKGNFEGEPASKAIRDLGNLIGKALGQKEPVMKMEIDRFGWNDDNEHYVKNIYLKPVSQKEFDKS